MKGEYLCPWLGLNFEDGDEVLFTLCFKKLARRYYGIFVEKPGLLGDNMPPVVNGLRSIGDFDFSHRATFQLMADYVTPHLVE